MDSLAPLSDRALRERLSGIQGQIDDLRSELPNRAERAALAGEGAQVAKDLSARGIMTGEQARQRRTDYLAADQAVTDLRSQISLLEAQAAELRVNIEKLPSDEAQTRAQLQQEIVALEEKRASADAQSNTLLVAPVAGKVNALQVAVGQAADPSKPLMTITPDGSVLQGEIFVPSRASGFVHEGQRVRILYDAFPHERFGPGWGRVARISATVLKPDELVAAIKVTEPVYRVLVKLARIIRRGWRT